MENFYCRGVCVTPMIIVNVANLKIVDKITVPRNRPGILYA